MTVRLRAATPDDAERIVQFWQASGASMSHGDSVERVRLAIAHPASLLVVAEADAEMIGTLLGTFDGWRGNMYRLVVHPSRRREGIRADREGESGHVWIAWCPPENALTG